MRASGFSVRKVNLTAPLAFLPLDLVTASAGRQPLRQDRVNGSNVARSLGFLSCASRINPTRVVKPAGDTGE